MLAFDLGKAAGATLQLVAPAALGGLIGLIWVTSRRRREGRVAAQEAFYRAYGHWYAIWKEWGALLDSTNATPTARSHPGPAPCAAAVDVLLTKAAQVEAEFETLLLRVAEIGRASCRERVQ